MFTLISYDIVEDKRRIKVFKLLRGYGTHVQYSVFECHLDTRQLTQIQREVRDLIDPHTDSVRFYLLDVTAVRRVTILGIGRVTTERLYYFLGEEATA